MLSKEMIGNASLLKKTVLNHRCPECGAAMVEVDSYCESDNIFTWYDCQREGCTGQWLEKVKMV